MIIDASPVCKSVLVREPRSPFRSFTRPPCRVPMSPFHGFTLLLPDSRLLPARTSLGCPPVHRLLNVDGGRKEGVRAYLGLGSAPLPLAKFYLDVRIAAADGRTGSQYTESCVTGVCSVFLRFRNPSNAVFFIRLPSFGGCSVHAVRSFVKTHARTSCPIRYIRSRPCATSFCFFFIDSTIQRSQPTVTGHAWHRFDSDGERRGTVMSRLTHSDPSGLCDFAVDRRKRRGRPDTMEYDKSLCTCGTFSSNFYFSFTRMSVLRTLALKSSQVTSPGSRMSTFDSAAALVVVYRGRAGADRPRSRKRKTIDPSSLGLSASLHLYSYGALHCTHPYPPPVHNSPARRPWSPRPRLRTGWSEPSSSRSALPPQLEASSLVRSDQMIGLCGSAVMEWTAALSGSICAFYRSHSVATHYIDRSSERERWPLIPFFALALNRGPEL
ncbi:hypothetical protein C8Q74DRAFT_763155 [Fomes fomentarius]|nr:hypothetical protein C8Q74DRAFT_763155 [Fomes fomentarius]